MSKVTVTYVTFDFMHYCTKGHRAKIFAQGDTTPSQTTALLYLSILPRQDRDRGQRDYMASWGMEGELAGPKGTAEGRGTMEMQVMKEGKE